MSASDANTSIYMSDTPAQIQNKISRHAFSGGQETEALHRAHGGDPDVDVAYQYLSFFEDDDELLKKLADVSTAPSASSCSRPWISPHLILTSVRDRALAGLPGGNAPYGRAEGKMHRRAAGIRRVFPRGLSPSC